MMPYVMQSIDTRIVHRSNALSNYGYGKDLIYREYQLAPNMLMAMLSTLLFPIGGMVLFFSLTRNFINRFLPKQGEGPNQDMLDNGYLKILLWGRGKNKEGGEVIVKGGIRALHGDPGYR
jgi:saccharopine dehydrogenase (NAD+, L-glutamate forming)